jgi:hypothetical protein
VVERHEMRAKIDLPVAFSVRDEHEFYPIQHLAARMNSELMVSHVGTGRHVNGGPTVFWGLIYPDGQLPTQKEVETALKQAGYDFGHNVLIQVSGLWNGEPEGLEVGA